MVRLLEAKPVSSYVTRKFFVLEYGTEKGDYLYQRVYWCPPDLLRMWNNRQVPAYIFADWVRDNRDSFRTLGDLPTVEQLEEVAAYLLVLDQNRKPA